jgi:hypothetical protein
MDDGLVDLVQRMDLSTAAAVTRCVRFKDLATSDLEIERDGQRHSYTLKPMNQLFGQGSGLDCLDDQFLPLLMTIEEAIVLHDGTTDGLTDGQVALALRSLAMNPEADVPGDPLARCINRALRLFLSFNDYSRQEVKLAIRKILKSVQWHNKESGVRGYLSFIGEHIGHY